MAPTYVRRFNLTSSPPDTEVGTFWTFLLQDSAPAGATVREVTPDLLRARA